MLQQQPPLALFSFEQRQKGVLPTALPHPSEHTWSTPLTGALSPEARTWTDPKAEEARVSVAECCGECFGKGSWDVVPVLAAE